MYVDNQQTYGHLVSIANFETNHLHNDLYTILENRYVRINSHLFIITFFLRQATGINTTPCLCSFIILLSVAGNI